MQPVLNPAIYVLLWIVAFIAIIFTAAMLIRVIYNFLIEKHDRKRK